MTKPRIKKVYISRFFTQNDVKCDIDEPATIDESFKGFTTHEQQISLELSTKVAHTSEDLNISLNNLKSRYDKCKKECSKRKSIKNDRKILVVEESSNNNNIEDTLSIKLENLSIESFNDNKKLEDFKDEKKIELKNFMSRKEEDEKFKYKTEIVDIPNDAEEELDSKYFKYENSIHSEQKFVIKTKVPDLPNVVKPELKYAPKFTPPKSPHNLIEEELYYNPWALLVATIFLNKTACKNARPCVFWFLKENPDPQYVLKNEISYFEKYFVNLGLQRTRATQVWRMSHDYLHKDWKNVKELYGIGQYGEDAYRIFCLGDFSVEPKDRFLKIYKAWFQMMDNTGKTDEYNTYMR